MIKKDFNMFMLLAATALIIGIAIVSISVDNINARNEQDVVEEPVEKIEPEEPVEEIPEEKTIPESLTGLFVGFDASRGLTDVLMVGHLDTEKNEVKVISVPRDLTIDFREEEFKHIKENNPDNNILYCKITDVYSLTGWNEEALMDVKEIVSIITGLEIDYMATIDVNGFSEVVDVIGGVEFDVPTDMYHTDPAQDLYINLKKGQQLLDGDKAEQLVRYRDYLMGDLQRIQVQQDFMVAAFEKMMNINSFEKITELVKTSYNYFEADFGLLFALEYAEYFFKLDVNNILNSDNMITIPSYGEKVDGIWYQRWDKEATNELLEEFMNE